MTKLTLLIFFLCFIRIAISIEIESSTMDRIVQNPLNGAHLVWHRESGSFLFFLTCNPQVELTYYAPKDQMFLQYYRFYEDEGVLLERWLLAIMPTQFALEQQLKVESWMSTTSFDDNDDHLFYEWIENRSNRDPFTVIAVFLDDDGKIRDTTDEPLSSRFKGRRMRRL